jgi:L-amino acid N-acyltransferase YncA
MIRGVTEADYEAVARIYNHYVANTIVTFEEQPVRPEEMAVRVQEVRDAALPWLVVEVDDEVAGYACATRWKGRCAYRFSAEVTVYLRPDQAGKGLGSALYGELFPILRNSGIHVVLGGIALPNEASVALHEKFGMDKVAHFREVGYKLGRWVDVGYWQRTMQPAHEAFGSADAGLESNRSGDGVSPSLAPHAKLFP